LFRFASKRWCFGAHRATRTEDALATLERDGLVNRLDRFAWPTRAALRTDELAPI
jgi:hypothetical protein